MPGVVAAAYLAAAAEAATAAAVPAAVAGPFESLRLVALVVDGPGGRVAATYLAAAEEAAMAAASADPAGETTGSGAGSNCL